jgi:hypothetical protein
MIKNDTTPTTLTQLEVKVLEGLMKDAEGNGYDFAIAENLKDQGFDMKAARGALSSLVKKDIITVWNPDKRSWDTKWTQITFNHLARDVCPECITHLLPENVSLPFKS